MKNLLQALALFQQEVPVIPQTKQGYGYKYSDLQEIDTIIKPTLRKYGIGYIQPLQGDKVNTIIFHIESGEQIESWVTIPNGVQLKGMNDFQVLGSGITYLRRYTLASGLGLITDEDADASGEQVKQPKNNQQKDEKKWLNLQTKEGQNTEIFNKILERSKKEEITLERLQESYKISKKDIELLAKHNII